MTRTLLATATALLLAGCGGGGSSAPAALPAVVVTSAPTAAPSGLPSASPAPSPTATHIAASPSASPAATATPTVAPQLHVAGAPASVFTTQGLVRRSAEQARQIQTNLGNGQIPTVVGATSPYYGTIFTSMFVWAATAQSTPVQQTSLQAIPANAVSGPVAVASIGRDNGNLFAATYFDWSVAFTINKVGKDNVVATFGDGTTGSIPVYIYDEWYLTCGSVVDVSHPMEWAYTAGVPKGVFGATSDMTVDCTGRTVTFTNGAVQKAASVADAWGNVASAFTVVLSGTTTAAPLTMPVSSLVNGATYIVKLSDGGYAKLMTLSNDGTAVSPNISGISLHDSPSGSGLFAF